MKKPLSKTKFQELKTLAHHLKPVVMIGEKGLTKNVLEEINVALIAHELIKIKINGADREQRNLIAKEIGDSLEAHPLQMIGRTLILYRENEEN